MQRDADGSILHYVSQELTPGSRVTLSVDFSRRYDFMQNHTGKLLYQFCSLLLL